jgi:hypothetical protein
MFITSSAVLYMELTLLWLSCYVAFLDLLHVKSFYKQKLVF